MACFVKLKSVKCHMRFNLVVTLTTCNRLHFACVSLYIQFISSCLFAIMLLFPISKYSMKCARSKWGFEMDTCSFWPEQCNCTVYCTGHTRLYLLVVLSFISPIVTLCCVHIIGWSLTLEQVWDINASFLPVAPHLAPSVSILFTPEEHYAFSSPVFSKLVGQVPDFCHLAITFYTRSVFLICRVWSAVVCCGVCISACQQPCFLLVYSIPHQPDQHTDLMTNWRHSCFLS